MNNQNQQENPFPQPRILPLPGIKDLLKRSWQIYKARLGTFLGIVILPLVVGLLILIPTAILGKIPALGIFLFIVFWLAAIVVSFWSQVSLLYAIKEREEKIGIKESLKCGWPKIVPFIWISILAGFITMGGFLLLVIPGILFAVWFSFATYILVSEDIKGMSALFRSKQLVAGNWWKVFWRLLTIGIITIVAYFGLTFLFTSLFNENAGSIAGSITSLFLTPFLITYNFLIYEDLKKLKGEILPNR
jgi:hypothetical protein